MTSMRAAVHSVISVSSWISGFPAVFEILAHTSGHAANKTIDPFGVRQDIMPNILHDA